MASGGGGGAAASSAEFAVQALACAVVTGAATDSPLASTARKHIRTALKPRFDGFKCGDAASARRYARVST